MKKKKKPFRKHWIKPKINQKVKFINVAQSSNCNATDDTCAIISG